MTSWVVSINQEHPRHWEIAKRHGFWDLPRQRKIKKNDFVYFWQAGQSFVAKTRATTDATPILPGATASWEDSGQRIYTYRFSFTVLSESPSAQPAWEKEVGPRFKRSIPKLNSTPSFVEPEDEAVLDSYFLSTFEERFERLLSEQQTDIDDEAFGELPGADQMSKGERKVAKVIRTFREGQESFRQELIGAYGCCAVTGTREREVLEGAHIIPYRGRHSNVLRNGLLLRRDVHRLFDRHLLTIDACGTVRVSPQVSEEMYRKLDGIELRKPRRRKDRPHPDFLESQRQECRSWFVA